MLRLDPPFRRATIDDAPALVDLVHFASEGLALHIWQRMAGPGGDARAIGLDRARRDTGSFTWRNAVVAAADGKVAAGVIGYALPDVAEPIPADMTPMFVPLQELENLACGTWYVNVLAAYPEHRGKGYGARLLAIADEIGEGTGCRDMSIIVSDANEGARRLYERSGYNEKGRRKKVKEDWRNPGTDWVLLVKSTA